MQATGPATHDLVLIGGGHTHVAVLKRFGMRPCPGLRLTLISNVPAAPYSGMLPGCLAGHYTFDEAHIELRPLCRMAGANFYHAAATGLDLDRRLVHCAGRPPVHFDFLSINTGGAPDQSVPGASTFALPVKPVDRFLAGIEERFASLASHQGPPPNWLVVGGGAGGVEVMLALQYRLQQYRRSARNTLPEVALHLVVASPEILLTHNAGVRRRYRRVLQERGVHVHVKSGVNEVMRNRVACETGSEIPYHTLIWATGVKAPAWIRESGLATDDKGFLAVNASLQSTSHPFVFAAGDVATVLPHPRPKSGVFAVRQGPPLTENLRRAADGQPLRPFKPQREFLSLISTGDRYAVASRGPWAWEGAWVWRFKDWIDRRWMRGYQELPDMSRRRLQSARAVRTTSTLETGPRCGGCGSKIGAEVLSRVLARLRPVERDDVLAGLAARDDAALLRVPPGMISVQTVDFFRAMIDDPYRFGQITAQHCLGDIHAMGAEPQSALATVCVPHGSESVVEETLHQMLQGAGKVFNEHRTALVGGHTSESAELGLGFTVNGLIAEADLWRKGGLRAGNVLILTKPVGTGTLLAADMRGRAKGRWIEAALDSMTRSSRDAVGILREHGARACTDVTGFGVLGHLLEMLEASENAAAVLRLEALPVLEGAMESAADGFLSTLHPQNRRFAQRVAGDLALLDHPLAALWLDPQTAGGLLAGVPADQADACVRALKERGYAGAAAVGTVVDRVEGRGLILVES